MGLKSYLALHNHLLRRVQRHSELATLFTPAPERKSFLLKQRSNIGEGHSLFTGQFVPGVIQAKLPPNDITVSDRLMEVGDINSISPVEIRFSPLSPVAQQVASSEIQQPAVQTTSAEDVEWRRLQTLWRRHKEKEAANSQTQESRSFTLDASQEDNKNIQAKPLSKRGPHLSNPVENNIMPSVPLEQGEVAERLPESNPPSGTTMPSSTTMQPSHLEETTPPQADDQPQTLGQPLFEPTPRDTNLIDPFREPVGGSVQTYHYQDEPSSHSIPFSSVDRPMRTQLIQPPSPAINVGEQTVPIHNVDPGSIQPKASNQILQTKREIPSQVQQESYYPEARGEKFTQFPEPLPEKFDEESSSSPQLQTLPLQTAWSVQRREIPLSQFPNPEENIPPQVHVGGPPAPDQIEQESFSSGTAASLSEAQTQIEILPPRHPPPIMQRATTSKRDGESGADKREAASALNIETEVSPEKGLPGNTQQDADLIQPGLNRENDQVSVQGVIQTAIGPLPRDLWDLIGERPPSTSMPLMPVFSPSTPVFPTRPELLESYETIEGTHPKESSLTQTPLGGVPAALTGFTNLSRPGQTLATSETLAMPERASFINPVANLPTNSSSNIEQMLPLPNALSEGKADGGGGTQIRDLDLDELAQQVFVVIRRRISIEWERNRQG